MENCRGTYIEKIKEYKASGFMPETFPLTSAWDSDAKQNSLLFIK